CAELDRASKLFVSGANTSMERGRTRLPVGGKHGVFQSARRLQLSRDSRRIVPHECQKIRLSSKTDLVGTERGGARNGHRCLVQAIHDDERGGEVFEGSPEGGIETRGSSKRFNRCVVLRKRLLGGSQAVERERFARKGGRPRLRQFERLVPRLRGVPIV